MKDIKLPFGFYKIKSKHSREIITDIVTNDKGIIIKVYSLINWDGRSSFYRWDADKDIPVAFDSINDYIRLNSYIRM